MALLAILSACNPDKAGPGITASEPVAVATVIPSTLELPVGVSFQLNVMLGDAAGNVLPDRTISGSFLTSSSGGEPAAVVGDAKGRTGRVVTWHSDRPSVVSVDEAGIITSLSAGDATVTAESEERTASAHVTIVDTAAAPLALIPARATLSAGESIELQTLFAVDAPQPADTAGLSITWKVTPLSRVRVTSPGRITALAAGIVTVTASDGQHNASSELKVSPTTVVQGLDFPGNAGVESTLRFEFTSPPPAFPATYIWRAYPRKHPSCHL